MSAMKNWRDPYPAPRVIVHDGFHVVRDDLLGYGSKVRFVDYLIGHDPAHANINEWVFGSCPATGYAQISLPVVCKAYGKRAVLFMAKRSDSKLHDYQKLGAKLGAIYKWVDMGMLTVTQARARDYVAEDPKTRALLPLGLEHPSVIASIEIVARSLKIEPAHVWSVGSSGTLTRGLQAAFPNAEVHVVSVGHAMSEREIGRAIMHRVAYKFDKPAPVREMPPFDSAPTYDAKGWQPMLDYYKTHAKPNGPVLFWNVGA